MAFTKITAAGIGSTETVTLDGVSVINNESIGGNLTVTGNATVGGVLTYEDVTNVDSVGLITARNGIVVGSGITLSKDGDIFATGVSTVSFLRVDNSSNTGISFMNDDAKIETGSSGNMLGIQGGATNMGGRIELRGGNDTGDIRMFAQGATSTQVERLRIEKAGNVNITQNVKVAGVVTATSFSGSGADLTGLQAGKFVTDGVGITTTTPVGIETTSLARKDLTGPAGNTATGAGSSFHGAYMGDGFLSFNTEFSNPTGYYISTFTNALVCGPMQLGTTLSIDGTFTIV